LENVKKRSNLLYPNVHQLDRARRPVFSGHTFA